MAAEILRLAQDDKPPVTNPSPLPPSVSPFFLPPSVFRFPPSALIMQLFSNIPGRKGYCHALSGMWRRGGRTGGVLP